MIDGKNDVTDEMWYYACKRMLETWNPDRILLISLFTFNLRSSFCIR